MNSSDQKSRISIVRVVSYFYLFGGGYGNHVRELSEKINPYLKSQIIIAPDIGSTSKEFDKSYPIPIVRVKYPHIKKRFGIPVAPLNNLLYIFNVYKVLKKIERPDIIHAHGIGPVAFGSIIGKFLKVPVVGMIHGTTEAYSRMSGLFESLLAKLFKPDRALILDSGTRAPEKFQKIWGDRVTIVYHGIDLESFYPKEKSKSILQRLNLTESDLIILSISSLIPIKNIDLAIEAFEKIVINAVDRRIFLLIAGDGSQKEELIKLADSKGLNNCVIFLGSINAEQVPDYISIADICIGMSLKDNMNRSVLEPMACGKAIVAFGGGSIEKLITTGYDGFLAKRGDMLDFADKLEVLCDNSELRETIGKNARNTIISKRSWSTRIKQELSVYDQLIKEDR